MENIANAIVASDPGYLQVLIYASRLAILFILALGVILDRSFKDSLDLL